MNQFHKLQHCFHVHQPMQISNHNLHQYFPKKQHTKTQGLDLSSLFEQANVSGEHYELQQNLLMHKSPKFCRSYHILELEVVYQIMKIHRLLLCSICQKWTFCLTKSHRQILGEWDEQLYTMANQSGIGTHKLLQVDQNPTI